MSTTIPMYIDEVRSPLLLARRPRPRRAVIVGCLSGAIEDQPHLILRTFPGGINVNELRGHKAVSFNDLGRGRWR